MDDPQNPPGKAEEKTTGQFDWAIAQKELEQHFLPHPHEKWVEQAGVLAALDKLPDPHRQKKRATVLGLVAARLSGESDEAVFGRAGTCSRSIWYGKWSRDETISSVLADVLKAAEDWVAGDELEALRVARRWLALGSPLAAARLVSMLRDPDTIQARLAAQAVLDRAGTETASKSASTLDLTTKGEKLKGYAIFSPDDWDDKEPEDDSATGAGEPDPGD